MDNPIITQVIEQMSDLPPNLQEQVLEFVAALRQTNSQNSASDGWDVLESMIGTVEAPPDWSSEHDHYLYDTPRQSESNLLVSEQAAHRASTMSINVSDEALESALNSISVVLEQLRRQKSQATTQS